MNFHPPYFTKGNKKEKFLLKQVLIKIPQLGLCPSTLYDSGAVKP